MNTPPAPPANWNEHAAPVDVEHITGTVDSIRVLRLALNVLWNNLPGDMQSDSAAHDALCTVHDQLTLSEEKMLRQRGAPEYYLVIKPVSPINPPPPPALEEISAAVRALARHGMLVGQPDAMSREYYCTLPEDQTPAPGRPAT